jgi:hypothetical protein
VQKVEEMVLVSVRVVVTMITTMIMVMGMGVILVVVRVAAYFGALGPGGAFVAVIGQEPENQEQEASADKEMAFIRAIGKIENVGHTGQRQAHEEFQESM